jgi:adenylate cyclase
VSEPPIEPRAGPALEPLRDPVRDESWRQVLTGEHPGMRKGRALYKHIPSSPRCKQCNAPFAGLGAPFMRMIGKRRWQKNPHFCAQCFQFMEGNFGGAEIEVSMLFADVRGSTALAERIGTRAFTDVLNRFYRVAVEIVVEVDGLVDKFVGDEIVALFAPGWAGPEHARRAIEAADALLRATGHVSADGSPSEPWLPVGAGVHTGVAYVGTVGLAGQVTDFTALGDPVNATARLASAAAAGTILVSQDAARSAGLEPAGLEAQSLELRGRTEPMIAYAVPAGSTADRLKEPSGVG